MQGREGAQLTVQVHLHILVGEIDFSTMKTTISLQVSTLPSTYRGENRAKGGRISINNTAICSFSKYYSRLKLAYHHVGYSHM